MYREFSFTSISSSAKDKNIVVRMTAEVAPNTVNSTSIRLLDCSSNCFVPLTYELVKDNIVITLPYYPVPNSKYTLSISDIEDIVGNKLRRGINCDITFKSDVKTMAKIISPLHFEEISEPRFVFEEYFENNDDYDESLLVKQYYLEISIDNLFNNIVLSTDIDIDSVNLTSLHPGQYYARARVQNNKGEYGKWSETTTFLLKQYSTNDVSPAPPSQDAPSSPDTGNNDDGPIFYKQLEIIGVPKDGDDINSFFIEFNDEIDPDSIENIEVFRRLI